MAAEAQRAPRVREQSNFARRIPRPAGIQTSMSLAAEAITDRYSDPTYEGASLQILARVPPRHGAVAAEHDSALIRKGEVAIYDEGAVEQEGLVDGAVYAIEYQHARGHLPKDMWADSTNFRMRTRRQIVIVRRHSKLPDRWMVHPVRDSQPGYFIVADGPYDPTHLADKLVGRVVGIYNPAAFATVSQ
jgi:hypothetical protein